MSSRWGPPPPIVAIDIDGGTPIESGPVACLRPGRFTCNVCGLNSVTAEAATRCCAIPDPDSDDADYRTVKKLRKRGLTLYEIGEVMAVSSRDLHFILNDVDLELRRELRLNRRQLEVWRLAQRKVVAGNIARGRAAKGGRRA